MKQRERSKKKKSIEKEEVSHVEQDLETANFLEIEKLQECGINVADINKLKSAGFCTVSSVVMATKK